ncbi:MAG: hypothetical protein ACRDXX_02700 [Stackebrandtia sp.]
MPTVSVTLIGLIVAGAVVSAGRRKGSGLTLACGFVGAWAGFVAGAFSGAIFDVFLQTGVYGAMAGHAGAVAGAFLAATRLVGRDGKLVPPREVAADLKISRFTR